MDFLPIVSNFLKDSDYARLTRVSKQVHDVFLRRKYSIKMLIRSSRRSLPIDFDRCQISTYIADDMSAPIPSSVSHLYVYSILGYDVSKLPKNLKFVSLPTGFNMPVDEFPKSLEQIRFHGEFNQPIDSLADSVESISFDDRFNQPIKSFPKNLKRIKFGKDFNQSIDAISDVNYVTFGDNFNQPLPRMSDCLDGICFGLNFNHPVDHLPDSVMSIQFGDRFNTEIKKFPARMTKLKFGKDFNQKIENLPSETKFLEFGDNFNQELELPESVCMVQFGKEYNKPIKGGTLHRVWCGDDFNQPIDTLSGCLSLKYVKFGHGFQQSIDDLPDSVVELELSRHYSGAVSKLPKKLMELRIPSKYKEIVSKIVPRRATVVYLS